MSKNNLKKFSIGTEETHNVCEYSMYAVTSILYYLEWYTVMVV